MMQWKFRYVSPEGVESRLLVPDVWAAAERFEQRFCKPSTREDEKRFAKALEISRRKAA